MQSQLLQLLNKTNFTVIQSSCEKIYLFITWQHWWWKQKQTLIKCQYLEKENSEHAVTEYHKEKKVFLGNISNGKQANNNSLVSCVLSNF